MDKKDIYEHLAKIYLDASSKKKKRTKPYPALYKNLFFISIAVILLAGGIFMYSVIKNELMLTGLNQNRLIRHELALILQPNIVKINFNFGPIKEERYSINLDKLNLSRFKALAFSIRKAYYENNIIVKLELANTVNEASNIYISDIPSYKWHDYRINLADFSGISDWSQMLNLSFVVGEGNSDRKNGIVYIDNVRLLR